MSRLVRYYVYYGNCTSREACYTLADVHAAVAHFLRSGVPINSITKA
jgi:hypothetical protein